MSPEPVTDRRADELARSLLIIDTHIDVPYRLEDDWEDVSRRTERGDFDYPRARAGGLNVAFMSIYVPASYQESGGARGLADELIDGVEELARNHPGKFAMVSDTRGARALLGRPEVGFALGIENGAPIEQDLSNLRHFHERGVRYVTLTHSKSNQICDSSYDEERRWDGLSPFGEQVVLEMNRLGMMIDVSHVSDAAFEKVAALTRAPLIASHSSCRHFTPDWERNMSDEMIRTLAAGGGVIQINFGSAFISDRYRMEWEAGWETVKEQLAAEGIDEDSDEAGARRRAWFEEHPLEVADVGEVADHIDHVVALVGIDHVGLGSDFDGVGDSLPHGLEDVSAYPNLIAELLDRGYTESDVEKVCAANLLRVWTAVERVADELQRAGG